MDSATENLLATGRRPARSVVMRQRWDDLFFYHWRCAPHDVQAILPAGLVVDTFAGEAHIAIVGFKMNAVRPAGLPALPWLSFFGELNVRVYVRTATGEPGVFFLSLDCDRAPAVWLARTCFALNYQYAEISHRADGRGFTLRCQRRGAPTAAHFAWEPRGLAAPAVPGTLEFHLTERYLFFTEKKGRLLRGQVHHQPYNLQRAEVTAWSEAPLAWNGFPTSGRPPDLAHACRGVAIEAFSLTPAHA